MCYKKPLKTEDYENCLETVQLKSEISHLEKNKVDVDSFKKYQKEFSKNNKLISKAQLRFRSEKHNVFSEEINKIASSSNHDEGMPSIDLIDTFGYRTRKVLECNKEEIKCNNIIKQYEIFNIDYIREEDIKEHNPNWSQIPDYPHRIIIIWSSGSEKSNELHNLISNQPDIDKIYLLDKDADEAKYQLLINKCKGAGITMQTMLEIYVLGESKKFWNFFYWVVQTGPPPTTDVMLMQSASRYFTVYTSIALPMSLVKATIFYKIS